MRGRERRRIMIEKGSGRILLLLWALVATFVAVVSTGVALFLFMRAGPPSSAPPAAGPSPFLAVPEQAVVGSYKWIEEGEDPGVITLLPNHTFLPPKGRQTQYHRWEMGREALLVIFAARLQRFTNTESPGVYISFTADGRKVRMEKEP